MKFFFAIFLVLLSLAAVSAHSVDDLPEAHIHDDYVETIIRRSSPKRRRVVRRLRLRLRRLTRVLRALQRKVKAVQSKLETRRMAVKEAVEMYKMYKKCVRTARGKALKDCGDGTKIQKAAIKARKKRAATRSVLRTAQRTLVKVQKDLAKAKGRFEKLMGATVPRPSVSPLAIA